MVFFLNFEFWNAIFIEMLVLPFVVGPMPMLMPVSNPLPSEKVKPSWKGNTP